MSYYAVLDNEAETTGDVATNSGMKQFGDWVDDLEGKLTSLRHLVAYGWTGTLNELVTDLQDAIAQDPTNRDNVSIAKGMLKLLAERDDAQTFIITDGCI